MIKTLKYLLLLIPLLAVSCREEGESVLLEEDEAVSLTVSLKVPHIELTRGVSDDPRNEDGSWTMAERLTDGRELYHVTLFLVEETTGRLVGLRDIEYGSEHISDGIEETGNADGDEDIYGPNGFSTDGVVNIHAETGTEVTFTFLYDYPRHGECEKLRRGKFRLLVVANHTEHGDYAGLANAGTYLGTLVEDIKNDFDVTNGKGVDDFFDTYSEFFNFKVQAGNDYLCSKTNPQPLTLVQDIALNPGDNYVEAELVRTYARIRLEVMNNSSSVPLAVNSLSFSDNFAQRETYLFDDPDDPDRKYTEFDKGALDIDASDALTPFSAHTIQKTSSNVIFDAYILESRDEADAGYYYTLDVEYKGKTYELPSKIASIESSVEDIRDKAVDNVANIEAYFLIRNTSSGKYLYDNDDWLYQGAGTPENDYEDEYLWALIKRNNNNNTFHFYNKGTGKYISTPNGNTNGRTAMVAKSDAYYEVVEDGGALYIQANGNPSLCLNNWSGSGAHLGGYQKDNGGKHQFYLAQPGGVKDARYTTPILLETIDPVTAQVSQVESIKRNDFINVLVTVAFDEMNGDFKFVVVPWTEKQADIEFN